MIRSVALLILLTLTSLCYSGSCRNTGSFIKDEAVATALYKGFDHLYHFEFESARKEALEMIQLYPSSPWGHVLSAHYHWWLMMTGELNEIHKKAFFSELDAADANIHDGQSYEGLFCKIMLNSLRSRFELFRKNYISAILLLNKSKSYIRQAHGNESQYEPFYLTQGLFNYFMAEADHKLGFFSPLKLFDFKPDKNTGIDYLKRLTRSEDPILKTEGNYFLMKIYFEVEKQNQEAIKYSDYLGKQYPENLVYHLYFYRIMAQMKPKDNSVYQSSKWRSVINANIQLTGDQRTYLSNIFEKEFH